MNNSTKNSISIFKIGLTFLFIICFSFAGIAQITKTVKPTVIAKSTSMRYVPSMASRDYLIPFEDIKKEAKDGRSKRNVPVLGKGSTGDDVLAKNPHPMSQSRQGRAPSLVFDAYSSSSQPTDPSGAVGPNHYFAVFNTGYIIYDKNGNDLTGQLSVTNIFSSGGCCDLTVSYDKAADRWVVSYLFSSSGVEVAVSDGPNPITAGWYVYTMSAINDYQKLSVWSDGYYMTDNTSATDKIYALERDEMLLGNPSAQIIGFPLPGITTSGFYSPQAFNVTNDDMPATGSLPIVYLQDDAWSGVSTDHIKMWEVDVNWASPGSSTISGTPQEINTTAFTSVFDSGSFSNLTQPGGGTDLDALQATIMNQAQFRRFGTHNSAVFNFVVDTDGSSGKLAGVRWFEFRQSGDGQPWSLYQEGTYTSPDGKHSWNASLIMDDQGNIGMGYTGMSGPTTSSTVRVSSFYTGRLANDPLGTMTISEELIAAGNSNFSGTRYGDYSKIDVDPNDDQSFWFIDEYMNSGRKGVVGVFKIAPDSPLISYTNTTGNTVEDTNCSFVDIDIPLNIGIAPSADADVNFTVNGSSTATSGLDFDLLTPSVTFPTGSTNTQYLGLRVYYDGFVESEETVVVDFTVNANGGDAMANASADTFTLTISDDNIAPISFQNVTLFSDGFESYSSFNIGTIGSWTMLDNDGDSTYGSTTYDFTNESYTGTFIVFNPSQTTPSAAGTAWDSHSGDKGYYCFNSTGSVSGTPLNDDYIFTPQINLSGVGSELKFWAKSVTDTYGLERFQVGISTSNTSPGSFTYLTPIPYEQAPTSWTEYTYDLSAYDGQPIYITIHVVSADAFVFMLDDISVTTDVSTGVQTAVNDGVTNDSQDLATSGTIYTSDSSTGDVMLDITNNQSDDYGCLDISVSRAGTGAQSYNGSVSPDLVMDKVFTVTPANTIGSGDTSVLFYFTESEIAGWESVTGLARADLLVGREVGGTITEVSSLTIGSFGSNVTLTGSFTDLDGDFYFGNSNVMVVGTCGGGTNTWNGSNWSLGSTPTNTQNVIVDGAWDSAIDGNIDACTLQVNGGALLQIDAGDYVKVEGDITVEASGTLNIQPGGSLVQIDDLATVTKTGNIAVNMETSTPFSGAGFSIVGSPMTVGDRAVYESDTDVTWVRNHNTAAFVPHSGYANDIDNWADDNGDNWNEIAISDPITPGEGYLVGGVGLAGNTISTVYNQGTLNTGVIEFTTLMNTDQNDSPNILSNPYASGIDIAAFLVLNPNAGNAVYFWEHNLAPSNGFPGYNSNMNYSMQDISNTNGVTGNAAASGGLAPDPIMPSGQGFGIKPTVAGTITFNNSLRSTTNTGYRAVDKDELHLLIRNETYHLNGNTAIGFTNFTEDGLDSYDVKRLGTILSLYTLDINMTTKMGIQMRSDFNVDQVIPLGFSTMVEEDQTYTISIREMEGGLIEQAYVYLKDNDLGTLTNLSDTDYLFIANVGDQQGRFVIVFSEDILGTNDLSTEAISLYPNPTQNILNIVSPQVEITSIEVYDVRGRNILHKIVNQSNVEIDMSLLEASMYFVKIYTLDGSIIKRVVKE